MLRYELDNDDYDLYHAFLHDTLGKYGYRNIFLLVERCIYFKSIVDFFSALRTYN